MARAEAAAATNAIVTIRPRAGVRPKRTNFDSTGSLLLLLVRASPFSPRSRRGTDTSVSVYRQGDTIPLISAAPAGEPTPVRAHAAKRACFAARTWAADRPSVPDEVDVELVRVGRID